MWFIHTWSLLIDQSSSPDVCALPLPVCDRWPKCIWCVLIDPCLNHNQLHDPALPVYQSWTMCVQCVLVHQHPSHDIYGHDPSMLSDFPSVCNLCSFSNPPNHDVCLCDLRVCHMWFKYVQTRIIVQFLQLWSICAWSVCRVQFYSFPISLLWPYICMPGLSMKYESNQYIFEHWLHKYLWQLFMIRTKLITCIWCIDAGL